MKLNLKAKREGAKKAHDDDEDAAEGHQEETKERTRAAAV